MSPRLGSWCINSRVLNFLSNADGDKSCQSCMCRGGEKSEWRRKCLLRLYHDFVFCINFLAPNICIQEIDLHLSYWRDNMVRVHRIHLRRLVLSFPSSLLLSIILILQYIHSFEGKRLWNSCLAFRLFVTHSLALLIKSSLKTGVGNNLLYL